MPLRPNPINTTLPGADLQLFLEERRIPFRLGEEIAPYTSMRVGGCVAIAALIDSRDQLIELGRKALGENLPFVLIGGGSNTVFCDGYSPILVLVNRGGAPPVRRGDEIHVDSGVPLKSLLAWCAANGAGGLEFLAGIPGTAGGAAAVNAGAFGRDMAGILIGATILDGNGEIRRITPGDFSFAYRTSRFKDGREIIVDLALAVETRHASSIQADIRANLERRTSRHPAWNQMTAGCFFKNPGRGPHRRSAGKIIAESGLQGKRYGDIVISEHHANFLVNLGNAAFKEIQAVERDIVGTVKRRLGITLEREVVYISSTGDKY